MATDPKRLVQDVQEARADFEARLDEMDVAKERYYEAVRRLSKSGMPLREIAELVGVSHQRVHQIVGDESSGSKLKRAIAKRARVGGTALIFLLLGAWWGMGSAPEQSRAEALEDLKGAHRFMQGHLPEEARAVLVPKLEEMLDQADR